MEVAVFCEMLVMIYRAALPHIAEVSNVYSRYQENFKSHVFFTLSHTVFDAENVLCAV